VGTGGYYETQLSGGAQVVQTQSSLSDRAAEVLPLIACTGWLHWMVLALIACTDCLHWICAAAISPDAAHADSLLDSDRPSLQRISRSVRLMLTLSLIRPLRMLIFSLIVTLRSAGRALGKRDGRNCPEIGAATSTIRTPSTHNPCNNPCNNPAQSVHPPAHINPHTIHTLIRITIHMHAHSHSQFWCSYAPQPRHPCKLNSPYSTHTGGEAH